MAPAENAHHDGDEPVTVTLAFPAGPNQPTTVEVAEALQAAAAYAAAAATDLPLKSGDPDTRRYAWHEIAGGLRNAGQQLRGRVG